MEVFEMVVWIVAIGCITGCITSYFDSKAKQAKHSASSAVQDEEIARMRERIEVLEKILTDSKHDLASEFERLERRA